MSPAARWLRRVRASQGPGVRLWTWPEGGETTVYGELAAEPGCVSVGSPEDVRGRGDGDRVWVWRDLGGPGPEALGAILQKLGEGQRFVFITHFRRPLGGQPVTTLSPTELLLSAEELASSALAGPPPEPWLRELLLSTEGWAGPASWLLSRYASEPLAVGELIEGEAFRRWFEAKVLDPLDEGVLDALETLADAEGDWHLDLWRDLWAEEPHRLAALEQGVSRWGLILDPGGSPRLPALLRRFLLERAGRRDPALRTARRPALEGARRDGRGGGRPGPVGASRTGSAGSTAVGGLSGPSDGGFELRLLGHPAVRSSGATVDVEWPLRRALLTVAFLALSPDHRASRDEIVHGVWPESDPEAIRRNFHPTLSHARRVLTAARPECGDPLPFRQGLYGLAPGLRWWVDAVEVETRARAGIEAAAAGDPERAVDLLAGAWRLFRGPLLEGFDLEWIEQRRGALRRLHLDLLRNLGAAAVTVGRDPLALDAYRALLFEEPFEETAHVAVMELYARGGRRDLLRRQFLRLQDLLAELNVEPARETQERYHDLMG